MNFKEYLSEMKTDELSKGTEYTFTFLKKPVQIKYLGTVDQAGGYDTSYVHNDNAKSGDQVFEFLSGSGTKKSYQKGEKFKVTDQIIKKHIK